ncbi:hypothetical protein NE556_22750, partial [[Clostridium] symbiosum]|nr:hypothetical protein [[Clostridium] symbiosum]
CEGSTIYHAGDLNNWWWEGEDKAWNHNMAANYAPLFNVLLCFFSTYYQLVIALNIPGPFISKLYGYHPIFSIV